jgi:hypothetical protein
MSPAQLKGELKKSTTSTDVYAFAMTSYVGLLLLSPSLQITRVLFQHIMTGQRPFSEYDQEATIILEVGVKDKRPARPADDNDMTDDLWRIIESCWATHPVMRPPIRDVLLDLTRLCATERPLRLLSIGTHFIRPCVLGPTSIRRRWRERDGFLVHAQSSNGPVWAGRQPMRSF